MNMNFKKVLTKYAVILLVYIILIRFAQPYGLRIYYTLSSDPSMTPETVNTIQAIYSAITFFINLLIVILVAIDSKKKKILDWLILLITFFSVETGICIFLIWQFYKMNIENTRPNKN